jgi:hypothetical protein
MRARAGMRCMLPASKMRVRHGQNTGWGGVYGRCGRRLAIGQGGQHPGDVVGEATTGGLPPTSLSAQACSGVPSGFE